jgi:ATP-dependent Zn protease
LGDNLILQKKSPKKSTILLKKTMHIEQQPKFLLEPKKRSSEDNTTPINRIQNWIAIYRLTSRQKFNLNHINYSKFLTFVPFALGFSYFLNHFLVSSKNESFFETNLPVLKNFQPKIKLETIEYIAKDRFLFDSKLNTFEKKSLDLDLASMLNPDKSFLLGQPNFLTKIKKIPIKSYGSDFSASFLNQQVQALEQKNKNFLMDNQKDNKQFTGLCCDFHQLSSGNLSFNQSSIRKLSKILDELPCYLKGLIQLSDFSKPLSFSFPKQTVQKISSHSSFRNLHKKTIISGQNLFSESTTGDKNLLLVKEKRLPLVKDLKSVKNKLFTDLSKYQSTDFAFLEKNQQKNNFYKIRSDFYKKTDQFNNELLALFLEKNVSYPVFEEKERTQRDFDPQNTILRNETDSLFFSFLKDEAISERILHDLEKTEISKDLLTFRTMSGYLYPDMKTRDLEWFLKLQKSKNWTFVGKGKRVKLKTEPSILISGKKPYSYTIKNFPRFLIEIRNLQLRNSEQNKIIYNGPSLVLNLQKSFDWKTLPENNLRSWFHTYLSPSNPLIQRRENFFGNYSSPQFLVDGVFENFSDFTTNSFLRLKLAKDVATKWNTFDWIYEVDSAESVFAPFNCSTQIPSDTAEPPKFVKEENLKGVSLTLSKTEGEHFFPLIQLKQPVFDTKKENFENSSPFFEFGVKGNPDSSFFPNYLNENTFVTKYASGGYKKLISLFSKNQHANLISVDNWEPLTSNSWLVLSQLSFAVFSFQILKSLADNYGRELLGYLLDLVAALGILDDSLKQQIEILTGQRNKGFRVVLQSRKKFNDIVGIQKLLLEIYEVVLFLRNSARDFTLSKTLPHGILLTGPPGTGKTLLVQAIAGEAKVPVIVLSGSSLIEPGESSSFKLQMVFQEARQLSPCIVFIDEIDTLSAKRSQLVQNPMATDAGFESFLESLILESKMFFQKTTNKTGFVLKESNKKNKDTEKQNKNPVHSNSEQKEKQLSLLSQLLIELDGIQGRDGVVVIGATNRPEVLDPALLRPGRFDKILQVGLPDQQKRVEILQFYGQNLGYQKDLPWNYLGERTAGFTAADLATLMNESTIKAILNQTNHTIQTIEHGIDRLTTSESEKYTVFKTNKNFNKTIKLPSILISSKMAILRLAYYQAGKIILSYMLETHPKSLIACLWPRRPTIRSIQITTNLQNSLFQFARLCEITDRLVGCYAGKAAEFLFLQKFGSKNKNVVENQKITSRSFLKNKKLQNLVGDQNFVLMNENASTLGLEDLFFAQKLVYFLLEDCGFYSKKSHIQQTITMLANVNMRELNQNVEKIDLYNSLVERIQSPPIVEAIEAETSSLKSKKENQNIDLNEQVHYSIPWWQQEISDELEFKIKNPGNGSRLYLYNPERTQRNPEWLPSDEFYHSISGLKNVKRAFANIQRVKKQKSGSKKREKKGLSKKTGSFSTKTPVLRNKLKEKSRIDVQKTAKLDIQQETSRQQGAVIWNDVSKISRDYSAQSLVLQSFNKAFGILNENRELLDRLVIELLYQEVLRKPDIENLLTEFEIIQKNKVGDQTQNQTDLINQVQFLDSSWGKKSRKPLPRWIDFAGLKEKTT